MKNQLYKYGELEELIKSNFYDDTTEIIQNSYKRDILDKVLKRGKPFTKYLIPIYKYLKK